jgi:quercetin dioxygenase-like cupin family protein
MEATAGEGRRRESPYQAWQKGQGIPIVKGAYIPSLYEVEVAPWARMGQKGAFINLADQEHDDGYVLELTPGGQTGVLHHAFESSIYVLSGRGATSVWKPGKPKQTLEWQRGSVFAPPLNCYYQHYNLDGQQPARIFSVTNAPQLINIYRDPGYVFGNDYQSPDRYDGEEDYFTRAPERTTRNGWRTNFIADIRTFALDKAPNRGADGFLTNFTFANNQMAVHCSDFPPGTYKKGHRHNVGAHVIILNGQGYSLLWFDGDTERTRVEWRDGSVLSPRESEYHQHFNTGPDNARYLAMRLGQLDARSYGGFAPVQIEYEDEDPAIYAEYAREAERNGAEVFLPRPSYRTLVGS